MPDQLTALDATFLELEEADETAHMHVGGTMVFDPLPGGGIPQLDDLRAHLERRLDALPRYRCRLSSPHTGGLRWPSWVPDENFDIAHHVRRAALPSPGGPEQLHEYSAKVWSHRLDRRRPLWEIVLVEGLADGRWALVTKTHHAMVDGISSVDAAHLLLDASPEPGEWHAPPPPPTAKENGNGSIVGAALHAAVHPRETLHKTRQMVDLLVRDEIVPAPKTAINEPIGTERRFRVATVGLEEVKAIKRELGGTVNDVVLAACTGGFRRLLASRGEELPDSGLRTMVPVNVRPDTDRGKLGNQVSSLFVHLPVAEPDPLRRYRITMAEAEALKGGGQAEGGQTLVHLTALAPPVLHSFAARSLFASRLFNTTITNVPGPQLPLYAFGSQMREVHPLVPLAAEHAVGIAVISYDGRLFFGLIADRDEVPDLEELLIGLEESLEQLRKLAHGPKEEVLT
jgi:diacylglycerol O-acyltransferase / wax synthase